MNNLNIDVRFYDANDKLLESSTIQMSPEQWQIIGTDGLVVFGASDNPLGAATVAYVNEMTGESYEFNC